MPAVAALRRDAIAFIPVPDRPRLYAVPALQPSGAGRELHGVPQRSLLADGDVPGLASVTVLLAPSGAVAGPLRLTARGVRLLAALVLASCGALIWFAAQSAPAVAPRPVGPHDVAVRPGDTLWSIASRARPDLDPRDEVRALQERNHLTDARLQVGQVLRLR